MREGELQRACMKINQEKQDEKNMTKSLAPCVRKLTSLQNKRVRECSRKQLGKQYESGKKRLWYKMAFISQRVLRTDGSELCIKAFT